MLDVRPGRDIHGVVRGEPRASLSERIFARMAINRRLPGGNPGLHALEAQSDSAALKGALASRADPEQRGDGGETPLVAAVRAQRAGADGDELQRWRRTKAIETTHRRGGGL